MDSPYDLLWAGIGNPDEQCKASAVEHPGDVRLRRPEWNVDIRTVRARQGSNMRKRGGIHQISPLFHILLKARGVAERPERSVDIRTVRARQGSNTQETCCPLDDPFILVTYPHFICIANSFSTKKEDTHTGYPHKSEHETGFEPATLALARRYSTTEPLVHR